MIRINLLPVRAAQKKESIRNQFVMLAVATVVVLLVSLGVYYTVRSEASGVAADIAKNKAELDMLEKKIGELTRIREQKRVVEEKLNIINTLEAARSGPVDLFKKISAAIPEKAWLTSLTETNAAIALQGT